MRLLYLNTEALLLGALGHFSDLCALYLSCSFALPWLMVLHSATWCYNVTWCFMMLHVVRIRTLWTYVHAKHPFQVGNCFFIDYTSDVICELWFCGRDDVVLWCSCWSYTEQVEREINANSSFTYALNSWWKCSERIGKRMYIRLTNGMMIDWIFFDVGTQHALIGPITSFYFRTC